jgi:hypothetical protein
MGVYPAFVLPFIVRCRLLCAAVYCALPFIVVMYYQCHSPADDT